MNQPSVISPVHLSMGSSNTEPEPSAELADLYRGFEKELLVPLWTEIGDLMPHTPKSKAQPHLWEWAKLLELAAPVIGEPDARGLLARIWALPTHDAPPT